LAIAQAARAVHVDTPTSNGLASRTLAGGGQIDTRPITTTGELTDTKVPGYVAKYATKGAERTGTLDRRITPGERIADLSIRDHARRLVAECIRLGQHSELDNLRLGAWAHMLGFRGHFSTKSRRYSTTLGALRAARAANQREQARQSGALPDLSGETILIVAHWNFHGRGHPNFGSMDTATRRAP